nr:ABC transporter substrate-binding protein [Tomitella biformata]
MAAGTLTLALGAGIASCGSAAQGSAGATGPATAVLADLNPTPIGGTPTPTLPVTVDSRDGVPVTITDVSRIVAVDQNGTIGETIFALGLGGNVVGRDIATSFPAAADIPNVTPGGHSLNAEAILALSPTVVLTDASIGPRAVQIQLRDAGIPVVFLDPERKLATVGEQIEAVAAALGVSEAGRALAERTQTEIDEAIAAVPRQDTPPKIAFLYQRGSTVSLLGGPGGGSDELITAIGGIDAGTASGLTKPYTQVTSEALIVAAPDAILMMTGGLESVDGVDGLVTLPGIAQTPAGQNRRVIDMDDSVLLSFGPSTGTVIRSLTAAYYGSPTG